MRVGIVLAAEPLVVDGSRPFRGGLLAEALVNDGHSVTWWTSNFDHVSKKSRFDGFRSFSVEPGYELRLLPTRGYSRNVSYARLRNNRQLATELARDLDKEHRNFDVLVVCFPIPELLTVALDFAQKRRIPVVVDIRDRWPDIYLSVLPESLRRAGKVALFKEFHRVSRDFSRVSGITAISESYLEWALKIVGRSSLNTDRVFPIGYRDVFAIKADTLTPQLEAKGVIPLKVVFAGSFSRQFNLEVVIDAATELEARRPGEFTFTLAGQGPNYDKIRARASALNSVRLPGWLNQEELTGLLRASSVGLCPYQLGGLVSVPNKPIEYFAAGLPVVSSLPGEIHGLIEEYGVGINYGADSRRSLVGALERLADSIEHRVEMAKSARRLYEAEFRAEDIYPLMVEYLEMIKRSQ